MKSGRTGEEIAAALLRRKGYKIIASNYGVRGGEIDIVAFRRGMLVFAEVKTRRDDFCGTPASAVDGEKIAHLQTAEREFLYRFRKNGKIPVWSPLLKRMIKRRVSGVRNDIIEVYLSEGRCDTRIIENAFEVP